MSVQAKTIQVIDIFAGPGGLSEGFSRHGEADWSSLLSSPVELVPELHGQDTRFQIALSVEMDPIAHQTLQLRAFYRALRESKGVEAYLSMIKQKPTSVDIAALMSRHPEAHGKAVDDAWCAELGVVAAADVDKRIESRLRHGGDHWVLIGGPPCQAYSLVGRSRNRGTEGYVPEDDHRHFLYKEYLRIVAKHKPSVFVMENVKGILSAKISGSNIFDRIICDLSEPGKAVGGKNDKSLKYSIHAIAAPNHGQLGFAAKAVNSDYIVHMEDHGIPQARHRVILIGIREDLKRPARPLPRRKQIPIDDVIVGPRLHAGISGDVDWFDAVSSVADADWMSDLRRQAPDVHGQIERILRELRVPRQGRGSEFIEGSFPARYLPQWFRSAEVSGVANSSVRSHILSDIHRYIFASAWSLERGAAPNLQAFPRGLLPDHANARRAIQSGNLFNDRFRVQSWGRPSTTITSHISKDGHYYIHPDPSQARSLTVREAARLQTFPDDYYFLGPRTQQYHQVGNAVPPLFAVQVAAVVADVLAGSN